MNVAALCGLDWAEAMQAATGVEPATSPDLETGSDELADWLEWASVSDVLALNLHGYLGQSVYNGQWERVQSPTALRASDILAHRWDGVTVFLEVCFSASNNPANREIPAAFYERGALAVIGSKTEAYGRIKPLRRLPGSDGEADRLLQLFLNRMRRGYSPKKALWRAKLSLRFWSFPLDRYDKATLNSFVIIER